MAFADVTKSYRFATWYFVVTDTDGAFFALRDMSAFVADKPIRVSFFVHDDGYISFFIDIFF